MIFNMLQSKNFNFMFTLNKYTGSVLCHIHECKMVNEPVDSHFLRIPLPINMISDFPIDYMHQLQVNLGVIKKLLLLLVTGPLHAQSRISPSQIQ